MHLKRKTRRDQGGSPLGTLSRQKKECGPSDTPKQTHTSCIQVSIKPIYKTKLIETKHALLNKILKKKVSEKVSRKVQLLAAMQMKQRQSP